MSTGAAYNQG